MDQKITSTLDNPEVETEVNITGYGTNMDQKIISTLHKVYQKKARRRHIPRCKWRADSDSDSEYEELSLDVHLNSDSDSDSDSDEQEREPAKSVRCNFFKYSNSSNILPDMDCNLKYITIKK